MISSSSLPDMDDREFLAGFVRLLAHVINLGHKIKIIHNISRDMGEMFTAIDFWLPFYLSGAVEPYYCPRYREHYFRRTMFIAPRVAALTSTTLAGSENRSANFYCEDRGFVDSLTGEFYDLLAMCRPLMHIFTGSNPAGLDSLLEKFAQEPGHCLVLSNSLSAVTMPGRLFEGILNRNGINAEEKQKMLSLRRAYEKAFMTGLEIHRYTEIVSLPAPEEVLSGQVPVEPLPFFGGVTLHYSPHEYRSHVEYIIDLLRSHKNYNFIISRRKGSLGNVHVMAKDDVGVIVIKPDAPVAVFIFDQPNMTNAFYCYLEDVINRIPHKDRDRQEVIRTLIESSNGIISTRTQSQ